MILIPASAFRSIPRLRMDGLRDRLRAAIVSFNGHPYDAVTGMGPSQFVTVGTRPTGQGSAQGQAITASGGGFTFRSDGIAPSSIPLSHMTWFRLTSTDNPWGGIVTCGSGDGASTYYGLQRESSSNDLRIGIASGVYVWAGGITSLIDGEWHSIAVTCNNTSSIDLYVDGAFVVNGVTGSAPVSVTNPRIVLFGERTASASFGSDGQIAQHCLWHRVLSAAEIASLHYDRWAIFAPQEIMLDSVDAGPPPAFIASWARNRSGVIGAGRGF